MEILVQVNSSDLAKWKQPPSIEWLFYECDDYIIIVKDVYRFECVTTWEDIFILQFFILLIFVDMMIA